MSQPGSTSAFDQQFLRINAIEIDFKGNRPRYPISVRLEVNGKTLHKSPQFGKDEMVLWKFESCLNIPVPASLMLAVQEVHTFKRKKRFAEFGVASTDIVGMDVFSASDKDAKALVKFKCESALLGAGLSELLLKEAEGKLGNKKIILESLGKYGKLIAAVMKLSNFASNVHPAAGAAVAVIKVLYEKIKEQKECHAAATDLIKDLASFLPFVDDVPSDLVLDNETGRVIGEMLKLFCETSKFVIAYSSEGFLGDLLSSHQDEVDSSRSEFKRLKDVYDWCIKIRVWKSVIEGGKRTEDAELRQLHPAMQAYYDQEGGCLEGTRTAVLEEIGNWAESESTLFWLHGVAGSGKSSIANSVAHMFEQQQRLPACFFCKRDDSECRTPKNVMPTLAYFLSKWHLDYRTFVLTLIQGKDEPKLAQGLQRQFNLLMKQPLASLSTMSANVPPRPLVIVIDALDECGDSAEARLQLAKILVELAGIVPWLKVFVTSRTLPEFQEVFLQGDTKNEVLDISTLDSKQVQMDILRFTKHCAQEYKVDLTDTQAEAFAVKAFGLFIWTSTVFRFISMQLRKDKAIESILSSVLAGTQEAELDRMYTVVVESASAGSDNLQVVKAVLGVLFCTARNRPLPENALLQFLTGVEQDINSTHFKNTIDSLQAVLYRDTSQGYAVRVCHPSFLDFVGNQLRSQKFWTQTSALDSIMAKRCLQIMISELKFNICGLESSYIADDDIPDIEDRITKHIPQYLQYSCLYWMSHLQSSGLSIGTQAMQEMLQEFLYNPRALYWLECLSIMKELKSGIDVLGNFSKKYEPSNQFVTICKDLYRFVSAYHAAIAKSTTHLYVSALSWVPSESLLAKIFYKSCHSQPSISLGKEDSWKAALWVAGTENTMICAAYSIDGKYLVSGSEDGSLRVWDTQTGGPAGDPLIGHLAPVRSVAYCPNRSHVVSGSNDGTLRIWDIQTGKPLGSPLRGHKSIVHSVAYSPDGRHIVSGSGDMTLRIWDAQTGNAVGNPFLGHFRAVLSVSCSPDGYYVASGSADSTLRIWDLQTGKSIKAPFTGHLGPIISLAYSPSGQYIVSGSEDTTVRIWDTKTGNAIGGPLTGHSAPVMSVAFSADGKHIVSGSHDGTLRIWDVQNGVTVGDPLVGHLGPVLFVAHSPVDEHIVSGSPDRTLRAWDMQAAISTARDPLIGHLFAICSIAYSPDKKHLVSGSQDKTLRVWDVRTRKAVGNPFIGHTRWVTSVRITP